MPTSLLSADTKFPNFSGSETTEEKVDQITNYLYMLVEQLRYSMANIGAENFNETEFDNIVNLITEPLYMQLTSEDGSVSQMIQASTEGLVSRIQGIETKVGEPAADGKEATGLFSKYTEITQTLNSITLSAVEDANGNTSKITLSADGITTQSANISFKGEVTFEALENKGYVTTGTIDSALSGKGYVTQTDLKDVNDRTVINGGNITTGIIKGAAFYSEGGKDVYGNDRGNFIVTAYDYKYEIGGIRREYEAGEGQFAEKLYLYTKVFTYVDYTYGSVDVYPSVKIRSAGRVSIEAPNLEDPDNLNSMPIPGGGGVYILGGKTNNYGMGEGYITLESVGTISIKQGNTIWEFKDGSLFKNYNYTSPVIP